MPGIKGRSTIPTDCTKREEPQAYRVWMKRPDDQDWGPMWECTAMFGYLRDCLDFIASLQDAGLSCVYQSPADCREIKPGDRRVVARPDLQTL